MSVYARPDLSERLTIERTKGAIANDQRESFLAELRVETQADIDEILEADGKFVRHFEVMLVIFGTFLNRFGDYVIGLLKLH